MSIESKLNERNYGISLLKILATIIVCLLHHSRLYSNGIFGGGNVAVEMFFMISGFYLARKAEREHANPLEAARRETITRLKRFMPYVLLAFIIYYPLVRIYNIDNLTYVTENEVLTQVFYLCGLGMLGYYADGTYPIDYIWYIYCLLIAVLIIYPLLVKTMKKTLDVGIYALLAAFILYGFLFQRYGMVQGDAVVSIDNVIFAYPCIIRAVAGILLGVFIYSVSVRTAGTKKLTLLGKGVMWGTELGLLAFEMGYIMQKKAFSKWDFISIILFMLILLIAFCYKIEIKSAVLKKMILKVEEITLQVYILQNVSAEFVKIVEKKGCTSNLLKGLLFWVSLVVISVIAKYIVEKILPKCGTMIEKRIFIQNS